MAGKTGITVAVVVVGLMALFRGPDRSSAVPQPASDRAAAMARATDKSLETVLERAPDGHFYVDALVNDQLVHFLVDTGATSIALTRADAETAGIALDPAKFEIVGRGASGDVRGQRIDIHHIAIGQKEAWDLPSIVIVDDADISLLGQSYLSQIASVSIMGDKMTLG